MITNGILYIIWLIINGFSLLLSSTSDVVASTSVVTAITTANGYIAIVAQIIPSTVTSLLSCVAILLAYEVAVAIYKILRWGYTKIPGIN